MTDDKRSQLVIVESRDSKVISELSRAKLRKVSSQQENLDDDKDIGMQIKCQAMKYQAIKGLAYKLLTCCPRFYHLQSTNILPFLYCQSS